MITTLQPGYAFRINCGRDGKRAYIVTEPRGQRDGRNCWAVRRFNVRADYAFGAVSVVSEDFILVEGEEIKR